jgi:hypothetical protein
MMNHLVSHENEADDDLDSMLLLELGRSRCMYIFLLLLNGRVSLQVHLEVRPIRESRVVMMDSVLSVHICKTFGP